MDLPLQAGGTPVEIGHAVHADVAKKLGPGRVELAVAAAQLIQVSAVGRDGGGHGPIRRCLRRQVVKQGVSGVGLHG